jgi:transcriptional regulator with XRE-family HTH domain
MEITEELQTLTQETQIIIGNNIKVLREKKGWTTEKLAEKLKSRTSYIQKIESGNSTLSFIKILQFAKVFDVRMEEMVAII